METSKAKYEIGETFLYSWGGLLISLFCVS